MRGSSASCMSSVGTLMCLSALEGKLNLLHTTGMMMELMMGEGLRMELFPFEVSVLLKTRDLK